MSACSKVINNVLLSEINPKNGTQKYVWGDDVTNVMYLSGFNRASNVKVGDRGKLVYKSTASSGLYWFSKDC
jgi:hypothetical protein